MIKRKLKTCVSCLNKSYIFGHGMCQRCYRSKQKPLPKPKKQIAKFSKTSLDKLKRYRKLRDKFLEENPICQYPECNSREVTLHHSRGRLGNLLTDKRFFKSLCWPHHQHIEQNPDLAKSLGLSFSRLNKEQ